MAANVDRYGNRLPTDSDYRQPVDGPPRHIDTRIINHPNTSPGGGGGGYTSAPGVEQDPAGQIGALGLMGRNYDITHGQVDPYTREPTQDEMSAYHLEQMLRSNSPLMRRASAQGMAIAGSRGLMNSSLAAGASQGVMIDRAQPFALSDADAYRQAASESLGAVNQARQTTAELMTRANIAAADLTGRLDQISAQGQVQGVLDESQRRWQTGERQDSQGWQTGERIGSQDFQAGENALNRNWQTGEREAAEHFQSGENQLNRDWTSEENMHERMYNWAVAQLDALARMNMTQDSAMAQVMASIFSNPELTADEQRAAWANAQQAFSDLYGRGFEPPDWMDTLDPFPESPSGSIPEEEPPPESPPGQAPPGDTPPGDVPHPGGSGGSGGAGGGTGGTYTIHGGPAYNSTVSPNAGRATQGLPPV